MKASQNPHISVIMSVCNGMPYLREAVKSILNQTYKNFEFIIVDDASSDGTWKYLKSLKDRRIKLIKNPKNLGLAASLNKSLTRASGDYIARMDADDISLPERFAKQIEFLLKNPSVDLCGTWADLISESGQIIGEKKFPKTHGEIEKMLMILSPVIHPSILAKAEVFKNLKGYDTHFEYAEDYEFLLRAKDKFKIANVPRKLFRWRLWNERRSRKNMSEIDKADLKVKLESFKKGYFPKSYLTVIVLKLITTFLIPYSLKKLIAKQIRLA